MATDLQRPALGVLLGGTSPEREVSLASGEAIATALESAGWVVHRFDYGAEGTGDAPIAVTLHRAFHHGSLAGVGAVFIGLHGGAGEDGRVQAILELQGLPYTGSGVLASALSMDKWLSKQVLHRVGVQVPEAHLWRVGSDVSPAVVEGVWGADLGWPLVVKPTDQGSTVGLTVAASDGEVPEALELAARFGDRVLIERYIPGREVTVAVIAGQALPVVEIAPSHGIYDYECKYTPGMSDYTCPADLDDAVTRSLQQAALSAFTALEHRDYARMDFRLAEDGSIYMLEANTLPGFTGTSLVPKAAAAAGIAFEDLCDRIARAAVERGAGG